MRLRGLLRSRGSGQRDEVRIGGQLGGQRVLVPLVAGERARIVDQISVGVAIANATGGSIRIEDPVAEETPAHRTFTPSEIASSMEAPIEWATGRAVGVHEDRAEGILSARRTERRVRRRVRRDEADTLILPRSSDEGPLGRRRLRRLAARTPCNVIWINGESNYEDFASILVAVAEGPHSGLAIDIAGAIAEDVGAYVDVLHVVPPDEPERIEAAEDRVDAAVERIDLGERANPWVLEGSDPAGAIVEQSRYYGLTVVGAPTAGRLKQFVYGSTSHSIGDRAANMVIAAETPSVRR